MESFCTATIDAGANLRPRDGILHVDALAVTSDARTAAAQIARLATQDADAVRAAARAEADRITRAAQESAQQAVQAAEEETLQRAAQLLQALERTNGEFLEQAKETVIDMAQALFDRLVADLTPRKRIEAAVRRMQREAPRKLVDPVLHVHPDDVELVPEVEWNVHADPSIARGSCRLEASSGEWCFDFPAAVAALRSAFAAAREPD